MKTTRQLARSVTLFAALMVVAVLSVRAGEEPKAVLESDLLAVLRSGAPAADKAIACKQLAIYGSNEAVPDLAKLLPDPQLSSWARIALEAIPGAVADDALRTAIDSLQGQLLVGTINSIGVRRDANAVNPLTTRLRDKNSEVASAAAVALGRIGNSAAAASLRQMLAVAPEAVRSSIAEGCVLSAERLLAEGELAKAAEIYDEVRRSDVPRQRILEATRGAILARNQKGIPLLLEQFQSPEKAMFQLALSTAREFPGGEVDQALVTEMVRATPERAASIIQVMADRKETVVLTAVLRAAGEGPQQVRLSAINALGRVGDDSCFSALLRIALEADADVVDAAKKTLAILPGETVDSQIIALLSKSEGKMYPLLIELVGQERIDAVPDLVTALNHSDQTVRTAALTALGETVALESLPVLVSQVVAPPHAEDAQVAQQALKAASIRMPDREACAAELVDAVERASSVPTKIALLEILGALGGTNSLAAVGAAARSADPQLQDTSSRLLGEWMTEDAAPVLLDLATSGPGGKYQARALRGYIRITRQFDLPVRQRTEMCQKAFAAARQPAEQKLVLEVLKQYPNMETLKLAMKAMQDPTLKEEADQATLSIAQRLGGMSLRATPFYLPNRPRAAALAERDEVRELLSHSDFGKVKLKIVKAEYGNGTTQKDVTAVLQKQAGELPVITLASPSYKASFGSDSLPEGDQHLKVDYVINGKAGSASFAEDALIILPTPK